MQISVNKFLTPFKLAALFFSFALASCGDDGGGSGGGGGAINTQALISGTAATGAALIGDVNIYGKNGGEILDIPVDALGKYSADVSGLTAPYLICAEPDDGNLAKQYSYSSAPGTANVTPLTTLALFYANNEQDLEQLTSTWPAVAAGVIAKTADAQKTVNANFENLFPFQNIDFSTYDFLTTDFNIGDAFDQILDELNFDFSGVTPVLDIPNIPGFNFDDAIDTRGIDIGDIFGGGSDNGGTGSVTITGEDILPGISPFIPDFSAGNDPILIWTRISPTSGIGITTFQNNVIGIVANINDDETWAVSSGGSNLNVQGASYDGTTVTLDNVTLQLTGSSPITLNGSLSR